MEFSHMHTAQRAIRRLALIGWLGLFGLTGLSAHVAEAAAPPGTNPPRQHDPFSQTE